MGSLSLNEVYNYVPNEVFERLMNWATKKGFNKDEITIVDGLTERGNCLDWIIDNLYQTDQLIERDIPKVLKKLRDYRKELGQYEDSNANDTFRRKDSENLLKGMVEGLRQLFNKTS